MKNKKTNVLPALLVLAVVVVASAGFLGLAYSFSGASKYVIENWNGDLNEAAGPADSLGGITFDKESFPNGVLLTSTNWGGKLNVASGSRAYTATELCENSIITLDGDAYASAQAQRLPTGTTLIARCLPSIGDERKVLFWNQSVDEFPTLNFSAGFLDALIASSSAGSVIEIPTDRGVWVKMMNFDGSSVSITFEEVRDSD